MLFSQCYSTLISNKNIQHSSRSMNLLVICCIVYHAFQSSTHEHVYNFLMYLCGIFPSQCHRLDGGLSKLLAASEQLKELNEKLEVQKVAVTEKTEACETLLVEIQRATEQANEKKEMAEGKQKEIGEQNKVIQVEKKEAEEALAEALPALEEAKFALQDLDKSDVTEIR